MSGLAIIFLLCAVAGGILFLFRLVLQVVGASTDVSGDLPHDVPSDLPHDFHTGNAGGGHHGMTSSDASFKVITFQGIMAFLMMFGLVGLAFQQTMPGDDLKAIVVASGIGVAVMFLQAKLMGYLLRLQTSGNVDMENALGQEGRVYLTIPANGVGKAEVVVQHSLRIFNAISADKREIPTGDPVRVVEVTEGNVLVVEKVTPQA